LDRAKHLLDSANVGERGARLAAHSFPPARPVGRRGFPQPLLLQVNVRFAPKPTEVLRCRELTR
jgi:hypothetical protein